MAYATLHAPETAHGTFFNLKSAISSIFDTFGKVRQFEALSALSDAELEERGLKRSDIARAIFLDNGLS
ncbi:hypothetical protein [Heliomarina baculiformis]|uniref:hypothetical protein n=1 Tax=Heliomarina baculiformis TaxID=2872036 RepID=UPI001EE2EF7D|nr:hypothetical protein [Heliomarina baculiformis]